MEASMETFDEFMEALMRTPLVYVSNPKQNPSIGKSGFAFVHSGAAAEALLIRPVGRVGSMILSNSVVVVLMRWMLGRNVHLY
jgi:hypothetical protein